MEYLTVDIGRSGQNFSHAGRSFIKTLNRNGITLATELLARAITNGPRPLAPRHDDGEMATPVPRVGCMLFYLMPILAVNR
jgi:hypothetical protein